MNALSNRLEPRLSQVAGAFFITMRCSSIRPMLQITTRAMGLQIQIVNANTSREIDAAFATFVASGPMRSSSAAAPFCSAGASNYHS